MDYEVIADNRGVKIFNPVKTEEEKKQKWVKAAEACKEAITYLEDLGFGLYYFDDPLCHDRVRQADDEFARCCH